MTPAPKVASGARRGDVPEARSARRHRRVRMALACYLGMALLVALAVAMAQLLPTAVGLLAFIVLAVAVVTIAHPAIRVTPRR